MIDELNIKLTKSENLTGLSEKELALAYCANNCYRYRPEFSLTRNAEIAATEGKMDVADVLRSVKDE